MRTEGSTATSSLSGRSGSFSHGHNLLDRRPPHAPSPSSCVDAANGDDDCSFATASTRSTLGLDSDSDDGSQFDEQDNLCEFQNDSKEEDDDDYQPPVDFLRHKTSHTTQEPTGLSVPEQQRGKMFISPHCCCFAMRSTSSANKQTNKIIKSNADKRSIRP